MTNIAPEEPVTITQQQPDEALTPSGRRIWNKFTNAETGWTLNVVETEILLQACRLADRLAAIEVAIERDGMVIAGKSGPVTNPLVSQERLIRAEVIRLLSRMELPEPIDEQPAYETAQQRRGRNAARLRWARSHG